MKLGSLCVSVAAEDALRRNRFVAVWWRTARILEIRWPFGVRPIPWVALYIGRHRRRIVVLDRVEHFGCRVSSGREVIRLPLLPAHARGQGGFQPDFVERDWLTAHRHYWRFYETARS